ncbi:MAG: hypothetical protein FE834_07150 [Gammaproteobacteria bacterium]|nr:hypothetical protein [Gammaproteobacteria bacterium]
MRILIVLFIFLFVLPDTLYAATEYGTFESFYKESSVIGWILAGVVALISGAVIFFTGGTASPIVIGFGSWIGGMMGLSGIAATNAGLALLGGGSIASGGFGIIGGTALLTAALSFGTDIVIDYTIGETVSAYKYSNLTEHSKKMKTLPLPMNDSGSDAYENAMEVLEGIDKESPIFSNNNQQVIHQAITALETSKDIPDADEWVENNSLLSLLSFVSNDYVRAEEFSYLAIKSARDLGIKRTLPAFIYATSSLYREDFNFTSTTKHYFRYSILEEPENPLIPLLFSIYLDRMLLRFNDGFLDEKTLSNIFDIMQSSSIEKHRFLNYTILLSRYFIRLKLEQQKITSLSDSSNETIKNSPKTLSSVIDSLEKYDVLINGTNDVMRHFLALELKSEDRIKAAEFHDGLLASYIQDKERLSTLIDDLRHYQDSLPKGRLVKTDDTNSNDSSWMPYILLILLVLIGIVLARKRT